MPDQHVQMQDCVRAIALGSRWPKDFAVVGRAGGMNGVQNQVLVLAQGEHQWAARLLQGNGHAAGWETPPQLGYPLLNGLRSVEHLAPLDLAGAFNLECPGMFLVAPVDSDQGSELRFRRGLRHISPLVASLTPRAGPCSGEGLIVESGWKTRRHLSIRLGTRCNPLLDTLL